MQRRYSEISDVQPPLVVETQRSMEAVVVEDMAESEDARWALEDAPAPLKATLWHSAVVCGQEEAVFDIPQQLCEKTKEENSKPVWALLV